MKFRKATKVDVPTIVKMIANDQLGSTRENYKEPLSLQYYTAFERIDADPNQELIVVENNEAGIIGTFQLTFIQYLTYEGGVRAQIEAVRVKEDMQGKGVGQQMIKWAVERAKERNAHLIQLTTDKQRPEAHRFYETLGFKASHEGMKMHLR